MTTQTQQSGLVFHNLLAELEVVSGLLIGGPETGLEAGGIDKTFIRNPVDGLPYVPGSSLKGKVRSLVERDKNKVAPSGKAHSCKDPPCEICRLFGAGDVRDILPERGPSRLLFRDAPFSEPSKKAYEEALAHGGRYYETKTETAIDRNKGAAFGGSLHTVERVPPSAKFDVLITLRAFRGDNVAALKAELERGLRALENDYLGSSGSRGYGKVRFLNQRWDPA